jgi:NDP-sugar pyrophosphorylase family protein
VTGALTAVVMAAGEGRRMRPLTERWPKPVLPIDGRPVLATLLRDLAAAGLERIWVVSGHLGAQVEALVGDGSAWKLEARVVRQPEPLGSADAVRRALDAGAEPPLLVTAADTLFSPGDLGRTVAFQDGEAAGALGVRYSTEPGRTPVRVEAGRIVALGEGERLSGCSGRSWPPRSRPFRARRSSSGARFATRSRRARRSWRSSSGLRATSPGRKTS